MRRSTAFSCALSLAAMAIAGAAHATVNDGVADAVFGQPSATDLVVPSTPTTSNIGAPAGVALFGGSYLLVADGGFNRLLAYGWDPAATASSLFDGQADGFSGRPNRGGSSPASNGFDGPSGIASSPSNQLYVADTNNHRVLEWLLGSGASIAFGQSSLDAGIEHGNGGGGNGLSFPTGVAVLSFGWVAVADTGDNRVVAFDAEGAAQLVLGQADAIGYSPNRGGAVFASGLDHPSAVAESKGGTDGAGIWVVDRNNHRLVLFPLVTNADALRVLGQPDGTSHAPGAASDSTFDDPIAVAADPLRGGFWVVDQNHSRVLHFANGATHADRVLGQPDFVTGTAPIVPSAKNMLFPSSVSVTAGGVVIVGDAGFSRVLVYRVDCGVAKICDDGNPCTTDTCDPIVGCSHVETLSPPECAPYLCDPSIGTCRTSCAGEFDCQSGICIGGACAVPCGGTCTGVCVSGVCCDRACDGPCEACNLAGHVGTCSPFEPGVAPRTSCGEFADCYVGCDGIVGDRCAPASAGQACGVPSCANGVETPVGSCDGAGTCARTNVACGPYQCALVACRVQCDRDTDCVDAARCVGGVCEPLDALVPRGGGCSLAERRAVSRFDVLALVGLGWVARRARRTRR